MRLLIAGTVLMVATASAAHGQAVPSCAKPGDTVKVFDTERREPFSGVLTTIPPSPALFPLLGNCDPDTGVCVGGLLDNTLQVRERLVYDRHEKVIRLTTFIIDTDAPFPTVAFPTSDPANFLPDAPSCAGTALSDVTETSPCIVERATLGVERILYSCQPLPSIMWVGTMRQDFPQPSTESDPGGWGVDVTGATFAFSTGYTTNEFPNPPGPFIPPNADPRYYDCGSAGMFNVTESVAGVGVAWAPCAVGTLELGHGKGVNP